MVRIVMIRAGVTDYDDQGRIKGRLDVALNSRGQSQALASAGALSQIAMEGLYYAAGRASQQTAEIVGRAIGLRPRKCDGLQNLDRGLWQGRLIEEVHDQQPKAYRRWQVQPETICPPDGEMISTARRRVQEAVAWLRRRHEDEAIGVVVCEPLASILRSEILGAGLGDLWEQECLGGGFEVLETQRLGHQLAS
ncbi:MAG: histidine phosphatase family protein [Pirellulaceae bacterium]|nr:histidine phosphatase family protein [Planctomycetales bacterium]